MFTESQPREYLIAAGAILEAGAHSTITRATIHAEICGQEPLPQAALIDFEAGDLAAIRRLLIVSAGSTVDAFEAAVTSTLLARGECSLEEVALLCATQLQVKKLHLFARWQAPVTLTEALAAAGVELVARPLLEISRAALITEHRFHAWNCGRLAA